MYQKAIEDILSKLYELKELLTDKTNSLAYIHVGNNELLELLISSVIALIDSIINILIDNENIIIDDLNFKLILSKINMTISLINSIQNSSSAEVWIRYEEIYYALIDIDNIVEKIVNIKRVNDLSEQADSFYNKFHDNLKKSDVLLTDLRNYLVHDVYQYEWKRFNRVAFGYEIAFYIVLMLMAAYFFGWYVDINTNFIKVKFAEQFYGNHSVGFYIQKISLLVLSTTLMAFLLKRSFMNRRLADESYRTAKELQAIPRYISGLPTEMSEKFQFDMGYKYFGNHINHESYTSGENLMHENIKANTDFIVAVKDLNKPSNSKAN